MAIAVNDTGVTFDGPLLAWASLHPEKLGGWRRGRAGRPPAHVVAPSRHHDDGGAVRVVPDRWGGSSGLYAVQLAIELFDLSDIVLCGVPLDGAAGHIRGVEWWDWADQYRRGWARAAPHIASRVRSMSGWTREVFGSPT